LSFRDKLIKLSEKRKEGSTDWGQRKDEWIGAVNRLYDEIEVWFLELFDEGYMDIKLVKITLAEEFIGEYEIDTLELYLGERGSYDAVEEVVIFEPIGRNVIGASGRIDIYLRGRKSEKVLLLLMRDPNSDNYSWNLAKSKKDITIFDRGVLEHLIDEWITI
jgi:hypothetical protein